MEIEIKLPRETAQYLLEGCNDSLEKTLLSMGLLQRESSIKRAVVALEHLKKIKAELEAALK